VKKECDNCVFGTPCALLNLALEEAIIKNDYKLQSEVEEKIRWFQYVTSGKTIHKKGD